MGGPKPASLEGGQRPPLGRRTMSQHDAAASNTTEHGWPLLFNRTADGLAGQFFADVQQMWSPTAKVNTHENVYNHMLQLRTLQPKKAHGHIGYFPLQTFKYFWLARQLTGRLQQAVAGWPIVCEVGFGTGMSTALFATATSSPHS